MATIIALFDDIEYAEHAAEELMQKGLRRDDVDMISHASNITRRAAPPRRGLQPESLVAETKTFDLPGVGKVFAEGPVAGLLAQAERGHIGESLVGVLVNLDLHETDAQPLAEAVRRGGTLLVVKCDDEAVPWVQDVLERHYQVNIAQRAADWRAAGWQRFDDQAEPYTAAQLEAERTRNRKLLEEKAGPTYPQRGAGGGVWSGMAPHTEDEVRIREHAEAERLEAAHVSTAGTEFRAHVMPGPFEAEFRAHFGAIYAGTGEAYEQYQPAYHFGAVLAAGDRFTGQDWHAVEDQAQAEWDETHPDTWADYRDAICFGWGIVRDQTYEGPERRKEPREDYARYRW